VLGRLTTHASDLGSFTLSYLGETRQLSGRQLANSNLSTTWSYLGNTGDRRLAGINNSGLSAAQFSNYQFATTPESFISATTETSDSMAVYPAVATQTATYNNLNQLTNLSGQALSYDLNGNVLSDGQRNYSWDAENRLIGITYPGQPGKQTALAYDGLGRRTTITSTPTGGGSPVVKSHIWCGIRLCQTRNAGNSPTRAYYAEGEFLPGLPAQSYYYGHDQVGSARRVFASLGGAPAYGYDPYGNALQTTARLTDFGYAGMFYDSDSGLYLTQYRAYDPVAGRWLSRDPIGETGDVAANLYRYVNGDPVGKIDPQGLDTPAPKDGNGNSLPPPTPLPPGRNGQPNRWVPCTPSEGGDRGEKWKPEFPVPTASGGQPGASWDPEGHWDIDDGSGGPRQRVDPRGNPVDHFDSGPSPQAPTSPSMKAPPWWVVIPLLLLTRGRVPTRF
jgi:RHS repeat-associated protein